MSTIFAKVPFGSSKGGWGSLFFACYHQPGLHSDPGSYLLWDAKGKTGSQNDYMAEKQIYHRDLKVVDNTMDFLGGKKKATIWKTVTSVSIQIYSKEHTFKWQ